MGNSHANTSSKYVVLSELLRKANIQQKTTVTPSIDSTMRRLTAFGLVGLIGTGAHYLVLVLLVELAGLDPVVSTTAGFIVGALINYILNYHYTFRSVKAHLDASPKFLLIAVITGIANALIVHAGVYILHANYLLVQIVSTAIVFLANFYLNSRWTFKEAEPT